MLQGDDVAKELIEKAKEIQYKVDAVAHHVTDKVPTAHRNDLILKVKGMLLDVSSNYDTINYVYVLSKKKRLKGIVSIKELLAADPNKKIGEIMTEEDLITAHPDTDQEKVAHMALRNNLKAIPIVDKKNKFIGVVPADQILSILDQESEEDLLKSAGYILGRDHFEEESKLPAYKTYLHRIPWIMVGLLGGIFAATVIAGFEHVLAENLILATFIPLVAYIANAVGNQTQTIFIRDLATRSSINYLTYSLKQTLVSLLIAISCWIAIFALVLLFWGEAYLGLIIGLAVFMAILVATIFALIIPFVLKKFDVDPAIGSGPFTTIIQDLLSIIIYFSIASALL